MEKLLGVGIVAQVIACSVVGTRLLLLAARTRQAPELLLGTSFMLLGGVGYPLAILARAGGDPSSGLLPIALGVQNAACLLMYAATWRTFRAGSRAPGAALGVIALGFGASLVAGTSGAADAGPGYYLGFTLRVGAFAWPALESFRHYRMFRRRLRIGLGDPVLTDRFRLWTISTGAIVLGFAVFLAGRLLGANVGTNPVVLASTSLVSLVAGTTMWLAFVPPARYLKRLTAPSPL